MTDFYQRFAASWWFKLNRFPLDSGRCHDRDYEAYPEVGHFVPDPFPGCTILLNKELMLRPSVTDGAIGQRPPRWARSPDAWPR